MSKPFPQLYKICILYNFLTMQKGAILTYLGFETLLIDNFSYDDNDLSALFDLFVPLGIRNFIFLSDFDFEINALTIETVKRKNFNRKLKSFISRNVHAEMFWKLNLSQGVAFNKNFHRIYALKKYRSFFAHYPLFADDKRHDIAKDLNYLIYKSKSFPILCDFDSVMDTSSTASYLNLFDVKNIAFGIDLNYLFRLDKVEFVKFLSSKNVFVFPMISHDIANYYTIMNDVEFAIKKIGKKNFKQLCFLSSKASAKIGY